MERNLRLETLTLAEPILHGQFLILYLYEVAEAIRLDALKPLLKSGAAESSAGLGKQIPHYLRFERPPVVESIESIVLESGERLEGSTKFYDYGVVSVTLESPFVCDWNSLVLHSSRWIGAPELEHRVEELLRRTLQRAAGALTRPYTDLLREDYYIIQLREIKGADGSTVSAGELLEAHAREIAELVRGESEPLSDAETQEVVQSSISYSRNDLLVVGWSGALIYGGTDGPGTTAQLLEYANTQLLEFRYYDGLLTNLLEGVYRSLEHKRGLLARWRLSREAARLNTIRLDVMELTEKVDNAIKFLSDMFYARLYGVAAAKVGVADYRRLVDQKLRTAGELYRFMVDEFNQTRSFVLELAIVIILIIDLIALFRPT
ncbi:MAG TPA: hypothetical protein VJP87_05550 [Candidatus Acidoferrales bacterium]|nr:hypothetical protein [Candidatus Acidoferrales bacterium]